MPIEDVFSISGRGTVATGRVERGTITKGAEIEIIGLGDCFKTTLTGIGTALFLFSNSLIYQPFLNSNLISEYYLSSK